MSNATDTPSTSKRTRWTWAAAVLGAAAMSLVLLRALTGGEGGEVVMRPVSDSDLQVAANTKVFFGHQSVGTNIMEGVPGVYADRDVAAPEVTETTTAPPQAAFAHAHVGENTKPDLKMGDFQSMLADSFGDWADVALMKFCYVDITAETDVETLFAEYQQMMASVEAEYPDTTFLHVTVPLTTEPGWKSKVKGLVGRGSTSPQDNAARERFNALMREAYADTGRLFDLAALESTMPDGTRVTGTSNGQTYFALYSGYAADSGHLTPQASSMVAAALLELIAGLE